MNTEDSEFARIEREQAMRGVPDAIHHTDTSEPLMYIQGWNDCRQAMLEQPAQVEVCCGDYGKCMKPCTPRGKWLAEQPAPVQQKVGIIGHIGNGPVAMTAAFAVALAATPQAQEEPVGCEWTPCMKLPVVVHVRKQYPGEAHVSTREGITPVHPDDLIMRGVSGEEYPIGRAIFEQTYTLDTTPQAQQEPMTTKEIREWWASDNGLEDCDMAKVDDFEQVVRAIEARHNIKEKS